MNYIGPGKAKNIKKSIEQDVNKYIKKWENELGDLKNKKFYAWAISSKNKYKSYKINNKDYIGIYETHNNNLQKTKFYKGKCKLMIESEDLSEQIWGKGVNKNKVIIFEKLEELETSKDEIYNKFNNGNILMGFKPTNIDIRKVKLKKFTHRDEEKEKKQKYQKEENNKLKEELKEKLDQINNQINEKKKGIEIKYKELNKKNKEKNNKITKKRKKKREENHEYPRKELGLLGEKLVFQKISSEFYGLSNDKLLMNKLKIDKNEIRDIEFYNKDIVDKYDEFNDKSVEKGCDIKLIMNDKSEISLEIKSSKDTVNKVNLTFNELLNMKENQKSYIILVHDILKFPEISIVKNFSELYDEKLMKFIIKQEIDISSIPEEYKI